MVDAWLDLSQADRSEALEVAAARTRRAVHLLEKDIWVVWTLSAIYSSDLADKLTFKGGTSLSKVYKIIKRFSEDVDLTYDIRQLVPDFLEGGETIPHTRSQERRISRAVRMALPVMIQTDVMKVLEQAMAQSNVEVSLEIAGDQEDLLNIGYPALKTGTGYTAPTIRLEFGARATGEPNGIHAVECDAAEHLPDVLFPTANPLVMHAERTFWEKATLAHVFCLEGRWRGGGVGYSRHWYDLAALARSSYFEPAVQDKELATQVALHKAAFFRERDMSGDWIDYQSAVDGHIQIVPSGEPLEVLQRDYAAMLNDGLLEEEAPRFSDVVEECRKIEARINSE